MQIPEGGGEGHFAAVSGPDGNRGEREVCLRQKPPDFVHAQRGEVVVGAGVQIFLEEPVEHAGRDSGGLCRIDDTDCRGGVSVQKIDRTFELRIGKH